LEAPRPVRVSRAFPPALTHERSPSSAPQEVGSDLVRAAGRCLAWFAKSAAWFVLLSGAIYYFCGETSITATLDGKPVACQVFVNDEYLGDTPLAIRLPFDATSISIIQPDDADTNEAEFTSRFRGGLYNIGSDVEADFTSIDG
jgi:hypothetical protein